MWRRGAAAAVAAVAKSAMVKAASRRPLHRFLIPFRYLVISPPHTHSSPLALLPPLLTREFGTKSHSDPTDPPPEDEEGDDGWEEEEDEDHQVESEIGDGGDGGGVVLRDTAWGERVLSVAREVLLQFGDDVVLFAFKVNPKGYIYVRIDQINAEYGCPSSEVMENFSNLYTARLDELGGLGEIPDNLAVEVSSPSAERLLKVPDDLDRFKDMPMWVYFVEENPESKHVQESEKVLLLDSFDTQSQQCVWKLANVRENRDVGGKGRPLSRKQKDWRLTLSFDSIRKVKLYLDFKTK